MSELGRKRLSIRVTEEKINFERDSRWKMAIGVTFNFFEDCGYQRSKETEVSSTSGMCEKIIHLD